MTTPSRVARVTISSVVASMLTIWTGVSGPIISWVAPVPDFISGGADRDIIYGDSALNYRYGVDPGVASERLEIAFADGSDGVGQYDDVIHAGAGDDTVWGELGEDSIYGGAGDDNLIGDRYYDPAYFTAEFRPTPEPRRNWAPTCMAMTACLAVPAAICCWGSAATTCWQAEPTPTACWAVPVTTPTCWQPVMAWIMSRIARAHTLLFSDQALADLQVIFQGEQVLVGSDTVPMAST